MLKEPFKILASLCGSHVFLAEFLWFLFTLAYAFTNILSLYPINIRPHSYLCKIKLYIVAAILAA